MVVDNIESIILEKQKESPKGLCDHMFAVARLAVEYAKEVGYDEKSAYLAGIAHDLFRSANDKVILDMARKADFQLSELMLSKPMLAHGPAAAAWLKLNIPNIGNDILEAVRDHTFPDENAPLLTKIIATADTLEPSRKIPEREAVRLENIPFLKRYKKVFELKQKNSKRINRQQM